MSAGYARPSGKRVWLNVKIFMKVSYTLAILAVLFTVAVWGLTFISTKILLDDFTPLQILELRFLIGWLSLLVLCRQRVAPCNFLDEMLFAAAGLSGVTLYFYVENVALLYTMTSNVSVIVSTAPFFTALLVWVVMRDSRPGLSFLAGFVMAMAGIILTSWPHDGMAFNPVGDTLALAAAMAWAVYSVLVALLAGRGYGTLLMTRRIFFYGLVFMIPPAIYEGRLPSPQALANPVNMLNLFFLSLVASALCFAIWSFCIEKLGADRTSSFIYLVPGVTMLAAKGILQEPVGWHTILGATLAVAGVALSQRQVKQSKGE